MQPNLFVVLVVLGIALIGTIITLLYYIFVQKPEIKREMKAHRKKLINFLQNTTITQTEVEKIAKTLEIEEFTVRDILLDLAREGKLQGILVFPDLYYNFEYCHDAISSIAESQSSDEIPLKLLVKEFNTTKHNLQKILIELITNQRIRGFLDLKKEIFILQKDHLEQKKLTCPFCDAGITPSIDVCPDCSAQFKKCGVCNLTIGNEKFINCPFCGAPSHVDHLLEWLKINAKCPVCKHKLHQELLMEY